MRAALILAGLMAGTSIASAAEVNLFSSRHYDTDEAIYSNFTEKTGITVNRIEDSADKLIERMQSEGELSPADVLLTVDTEEEFDWNAPFGRSGYGREHVSQLARFQRFCEEIGALPQGWIHLVGYSDTAFEDIHFLHYTEGGPYFKDFKDTDYADLWFKERDAMNQVSEKHLAET